MGCQGYGLRECQLYWHLVGNIESCWRDEKKYHIEATNVDYSVSETLTILFGPQDMLMDLFLPALLQPLQAHFLYECVKGKGIDLFSIHPVPIED
jgi:hypothetical protein